MTIEAIGIDPLMGSSGTTVSTSGTGFADVLAMSTSVVGPTLESSLASSGNFGAATIASATSNATYASAVTAGSGGSYLTTNSLGGSSLSNPYVTGGGTGSYLTTSTGGDMGEIESYMNEGAMLQSQMLMFQAQMGNQTFSANTLSNVMKSRDDTLKAMSRNMV